VFHFNDISVLSANQISSYGTNICNFTLVDDRANTDNNFVLLSYDAHLPISDTLILPDGKILLFHNKPFIIFYHVLTNSHRQSIFSNTHLAQNIWNYKIFQFS